MQYKERDALLLVNGVVYTSWASHSDVAPYTGWIIGFNANNLSLASVLNIDPNGAPTSSFLGDGSGNSFWNSGGGPAADAAGNIYNLSANGPFDPTLNAAGFPANGDYGDSYLKFTPTPGGLTVSDYFTVYNQQTTADDDEDIGSSGLTLVDVTDSSGTSHQLMIGSGKDGNIYVVDTSNMGKFNPTSNNIYQELPGAVGGGEFGSPVAFNGQVYFGGVGATLRAFQFVNGKLQATPASQSSNTFGYPGTTPSISSDGNANGIVWAIDDGNSTAVLYAYDATNLSTMLYNSNQAPNGRDSVGPSNKFITPTIANGKVYVATADGVAVFGLLSTLGDAGFEQPPVGGGAFRVRAGWLPLGLLPWRGDLGQRQRLHGWQPAGTRGDPGRVPPGDRLVQPEIAGWAGGSYVITFEPPSAAITKSDQNFQVLVDGSVVDTFTPSGTSYQSYTTARFTVAAGAHTITFQGLDSAGGDNTVFIDSVTLPVGVPAAGDAGFEQPSVGRRPGRVRPGRTAWTFSSGAGISANRAASRPATPGAPGDAGRIPPGDRLVQPERHRLGRRLLHRSLSAPPSAAISGSHQNFEVLVDGVVVGTFTPSGTSYQGFSTAVSGAGRVHTITFQGLDSAGGDNTAFIDDVSIVATGVWDPGFEQMSVGPAASRILRQARRGPLPAGRGSRPTTAALRLATHRRPRGLKSPSSRAPAPSARPSPAGPPAPTRLPSTPLSARTTRLLTRISTFWSTEWWSAASRRLAPRTRVFPPLSSMSRPGRTPSPSGD